MLNRREVLAHVSLAAALGMAATTGLDAQAPPASAEERANMKVVDEFIAAFNARDVKRLAACLAEDARFAAGPVGKFGALRAPLPLFEPFLKAAKSLKMTVTPGSTQARGPMVTHERVDALVMQDGSTNGSGTWFAVFGLRGGKIVDFIDFQIA